MPVPTDTLYNQNKLHVVFAVSAIAMLGATVWLVLADYTRMWRGYQQDARAWEAAMTRDAQEHALSAQQQRELAGLEEEIGRLQESLPHEQIAQISAQLNEVQKKRDKLTLPTAAVKGEIGPKTQQLERATLANSPDIPRIKKELDELNRLYTEKAIELAGLDADIARYTKQINGLRAQETQTQKQITNLTRSRDTLSDKLTKLDPQGLAKLTDRVRNAPLLDWFNPSEKVQQVVAPEIRTDLNFLHVETIDRCNTCHINIDKPAFEEANLLLFAERQLASYEGQDVDPISHPAVMLDFWENAARLAGLEHAIQELREQAVSAINQLRSGAGVEPLASADELSQEFARIALKEKGSGQTTRAQWYKPVAHYLLQTRQLLRGVLGEDEFKLLKSAYRQELVDRYNAFRAEDGLPTLSASPVLLGHPRLDLFVDVESAHPMKTMACASCHEGSGQETDFHHAAHMPRDIWVDAQTGIPVPRFLLQEDHSDSHTGTAWAPREPAKPTGISLDGATPAFASNPVDSHGASEQHARHSHDDVKITDPANPAPFAPVPVSHAPSLPYHSVGAAGQQRQAVTQTAYWEQNYHWHAMHYMDWEKPMHQLEFVQSSCNKCHTEVFDIKDEAPKLFEGRLLFAQMGCINCHAADSLKDDLDIKKVGPSLVHVRRKLAAPMIGSWVWSPKAFRPTTRMPHYFMLENNSSPVDILRTRTEVAAITHYLTTTPPAPDAPAYKPEPLPEDIQGDAAAGRKLFNSVGCLACHTNLDEHGQKWITEDLVARTGADEDQANSLYDAMTYNQRHWYALEHLSAKLQRTGPELSGVGTKLKAGRDPATAQQEAVAWVYDWVRNPRHYSSYTIMPSFRLSEQEAADLAQYLVSLERPGYQPENFQDLNDDGKAMLAELVATLKAAGGTMDGPRQETSKMPQEEQMSYLGKKLISHYGCSSCHLMNGFEKAASTCADLGDWGLKDPHKLDFGYFDHAFDANREKPFNVWKVDHEGLESDAPQVHPQHAKVRQVTLAWEDMPALERRPWLYHKLHNTRVYDRGRTAFEGHLNPDGRFDPKDSSIGRPFDKLKMPKFFLTDSQINSLVTFVTSLRKPFVNASMQQAATNPDRLRLARGRQLATLYNCYGCHNVEGNSPHIWAFFDVFNPDGSFNYEHLNNAPPRLIGQGAKTQPQWLHYFLQNVHPLRPWLKVRMPSFPMTPDDASGLVEYFAVWSQQTSRKLAKQLEPINKYVEENPGDAQWFARPAIAKSMEQVKQFAIKADLVKPRDLDEFEALDADLTAAWAKVHKSVKFQQKTNDIRHPFVQTPRAPQDEVWFARGEALFKELKCAQCHALGDEQKLFELWKLDNPDALSPPPAEEADEDDGYGEEEEEEEEEGYGDEEDGYGDDEAADPAPLGPVYTGPNLGYTAQRLQWDWFNAWLQEPATIQPGTKMPQWFPGGQSAFANFPDEARQKAHALYSHLGADQRRLLMDFIYEAGRRGYTPGAERLTGEQPKKIELAPLPPPPVPEQPPATEGQPPSTETSSSTPAATDAAPQPAAPEAPVIAPPAVEPTVSSIQLQDAPTAPFAGGGNGRVVGQVLLDGRPAKRKPIRMSADAYCNKAHADKVLDESMIVNDDKTVRNVFIHVKSGLSGTFPPPQTPAVMNQSGCVYHPHVMGVVAGQPVVILNSDATLHNVKMNSSSNGSFNEGMPVQGMKLNKTFSKPEMNVVFKCDVHPWMGAWVHVVSHPFFAVSDVQGRFEIVGLPPGTYTLEAVHESKDIPPVTFDVTVQADTSHRTDLAVKGQ